LTSQAFLPSSKDQGKLSVYNKTLISPSDSYIHYTQTYKLQSVGIWGILDTEILTIGLKYYPEPLDESPAHSIVDFSNVPSNNRRQKARKLKFYALKRGCLYKPVL
jgi:hypothetical protein